MMDYCARESTLNGRDDVVKDQSIKMSVQEAYKILLEMSASLQEFASIVNGDRQEDKTPRRDASSLWDEARLLVALAYENLQKLHEIKGSVI